MEGELDWTYSTQNMNGELPGGYKMLVGNSEGKGPLPKLRRLLEDVKKIERNRT
jgi:hypothetical protein